MRNVTLLGLLPVLGMALTTFPPNGYTLDAFLDPTDDSYAIFKIKMPSGSWFGLGLGTKNMDVDSDMIMIDGSNKKAFDMYSVGKRLPKQDNSQDLQYFFEQDGSEGLNVTVRRLLDTNDGKDFVLPIDQDFDLAWSINTSTARFEKAHNFRGAITFTLPTTSATAVNNIGADQWEGEPSVIEDDGTSMLALYILLFVVLIGALVIFLVCLCKTKQKKDQVEFKQLDDTTERKTVNSDQKQLKDDETPERIQQALKQNESSEM